MLSILKMFLTCLLIFPLFTGTTQAERSPLCEGAIVVEDSYVGETISVTLAGVEHDSQEKTYTLYWLVDCMLEDPAAVSPESIMADVPSKTALATSVISARVGVGLVIIDSSIWVAVMTILPD